MKVVIGTANEPLAHSIWDYIVTKLGNVTVKQPLASDTWRRACPDMNVEPAAMPHCGWLQQPIEAQRAFRAALDAPWK